MNYDSNQQNNHVLKIQLFPSKYRYTSKYVPTYVICILEIHASLRKSIETIMVVY